MMTARALMAAAAAVFLTATLAAAAESGPPAHGDGRAERPDYRIGPEDVLEVSVWKNEAMSQTVPVRPDGMISLPLLNDVPAAGMTPMELKELLAKRLSEYMPSPEVSVIVREVRSFKVSVIGEVAHPGRYELKSRTTVLDILAQAGGLTEFAARSRIVVLRGSDKRVEKIRFNFNKAVTDGAVRNVELRPGDIVLVP